MNKNRQEMEEREKIRRLIALVEHWQEIESKDDERWQEAELILEGLYLSLSELGAGKYTSIEIPFHAKEAEMIIEGLEEGSESLILRVADLNDDFRLDSWQLIRNLNEEFDIIAEGEIDKFGNALVYPFEKRED